MVRKININRINNTCSTCTNYSEAYQGLACNISNRRSSADNTHSPKFRFTITKIF